MQQLTGFNELQLNEAETQEVAKFLNTHYDEAFEKIIKPTLNNYLGKISKKFLNPELFDRWRTSEEENLSHCAELTLDDVNLPSIGFIATFKPFTQEDADILDMSDYILNYTNNNPSIVAGKKIYDKVYDF